MAKKSAKSKGYRKQAAKKPYLSKRDIIVLCLVVAAIAVGAFFLFRYDDGALKVQNGAVVAEGDNWLIVNGSNARGGARYFKLGEVGELDGYNRTAQALATDANIPQYVYSPAEEGNQITGITVTTSHNGAARLAEYARSLLEGVEGTEIGEVQTLSRDGGDIAYYIYAAEREQADVTNGVQAVAEDGEEEAPADATSVEKTAAEPEAESGDNSTEKPAAEDGPSIAETVEANRFTKAIVGYLDAARDSCVVIQLDSVAGTAEDRLSDEALVAALQDAFAAVTLEAAK